MPAFETLDPELRGVLGKRIRELGLRLEGSPVEPYVRQLYKELERRGLHKFRPVCYLTDEWGCPDMQPVLGIPFYLADPNLGRLERAIDDLEDSREIMRYMRHEAGHVFNYAYRLYARPDWVATSARSIDRTATNTGRCRSAANTCATWKAGTRKSIPTKISPKRLPCG